ncbi:MAG: signal recognition particle-docking protein FtsY [Candidatus Syntropharchaeia archaeon]
MFEKLKKKLSSIKNSLKKSIEETEEIKEKEEEIKEKEKEKIEEKKPEEKKKKVKLVEKAKAAFEGETVIEEKDLEKPLWELEMALLESDVAFSVAEEIVSSVKEELIGKKKKWREKTDELVENALKNAIRRVLSVNGMDLEKFIEEREKPVNILFVGVNGTGKTTTIAKIAKMLKDKGYSVVLASGDTFRAGAEEQIEIHAKKLDIKVIKHKQGADPAAVVYDAISYARAKHRDVVLADTAGRMHTNINLMDQLKKIHRVTKPDLVIFVDEAIAGNDAVERAKQFNEAIGIDCTILTKTDADAKGGAAISIAYCTSKPILFLGTGQEYSDLIKFDPEWMIEKLFG